MCGIAGAIGSPDLVRSVERMGDSLRHRGPDDQGIWTDEKAGVGFAHRRLSIIDLSPRGRQPMVSDGGRYVIVYNGEIYNYRELRQELIDLGHAFKSETDTEVLLNAYVHWQEGALDRLNGMFAFAVWDKRDHCVFLARDRMGVKPLYYGLTPAGGFLFASELRALIASRLVDLSLSPSNIADFLELGYNPAPTTVFRNIKKLEPAHCLVYRPGNSAIKRRYWDLGSFVNEPAFSGDEGSLLEELEELLIDSFRRRMIADVPVGLYLSSGLDSTLVATMLCKRAKMPLRTFTIGFRESSHNEADLARNTARYLGTDHTERYLSVEDAVELLPQIADIFDEPLADTSVFPTALIARFSSEFVKVVLSADGGDELFAGYRRYIWSQKYERTIGRAPACLQVTAAAALERIGPRRLGHLYDHLSHIQMLQRLTGCRPVSGSAGKASLLADMLRQPGKLERFAHWNRIWPRKDLMTLMGSFTIPDAPSTYGAARHARDDLTSQLFYDQSYYLADDILMKVDRATMAASIEGRDPLLDYRLVEFAARIPAQMKLHNGKGKFIIRKLLQKYLPADHIDRPKRGFSIPIQKWLRSDLGIVLDDYLGEESLKTAGVFDSAEVSRVLKSFRSGEENHSMPLFALLIFMIWHRRWLA